MDDEIIKRIGTWLDHGGAQMQTGPHAGAVAGWLKMNPVSLWRFGIQKLQDTI